MRALFEHYAIVSGIPLGKRSRKNAMVLIDTEVEIGEFSGSEAPVAYSLEDGMPSLDVRKVDGKFYRAVPGYLDLSPPAGGGLPTLALTRITTKSPQFAHLSAHLDYRQEFNPPAKDKNGQAEVRRLENWPIAEMDGSALPHYAAAALKYAENFVEIGGILHWRVFEPCRLIRWRNLAVGRQVEVSYGADTRALAEFVDVSGSDERYGFAAMGRRSFQPELHAKPSPIKMPYQERCFALRDRDGFAAFAEFLSPHAVFPDRVGYLGNSMELEVKLRDEELGSPDFERLELGRSARDLVASVDRVFDLATQGPKGRAKRERLARDGGLRESLDPEVNGLVDAVIAFDAELAAPEAVETAMAALRERLGHQVAYMNETFGIHVDTLVCDPYFSRTDHMDIDLGIIAPGLR